LLVYWNFQHSKFYYFIFKQNSGKNFNYLFIYFFNFVHSRIRKAFKCHCGKSYKTSLKLRNHTLLIHSGGSTSDLSLSSSSLSSLNSTQQFSDSASPPLAITLKNSINLVAIKASKANNGLPSSVASTSKASKESGKGESNKIPKLAPMKGYDGLGILTPATSPKNQIQQHQQQHQQVISSDNNQLLNGTNGSAESLQSIPLTPVSPAASPSSTTSTTNYQQLKKSES
jgi:hypothetical protein